MSAKDFARWISRDVATKLRHEGFKRSGGTFRSRAHGNWKLIQIQRSVKSAESCVLFTVNLGIVNSDITRFHDIAGADIAPAIEDSHWIVRLGELLSEPADHWWTYISQSPSDSTHQNALDLLWQKGLPLLERMSHDEELIKLWKSGVAPGLTNVQGLMSLSTLLCQKGALEELDRVVSELNSATANKPSSTMAARHITQLAKCHADG